MQNGFYYSNSNDDLGIETYIGIKDLSEGKHIIEFQKLKHKDTDSLVSIIKVPFWYYKDWYLMNDLHWILIYKYK